MTIQDIMIVTRWRTEFKILDCDTKEILFEGNCIADNPYRDYEVKHIVPLDNRFVIQIQAKRGGNNGN